MGCTLRSEIRTADPIADKVLDLYLRRYVPLANPVCPILGKRR